MVDLDWGSRCSAATECEDPAAEDSNGPHWAEWVEEAENLLQVHVSQAFPIS